MRNLSGDGRNVKPAFHLDRGCATIRSSSGCCEHIPTSAAATAVRARRRPSIRPTPTRVRDQARVFLIASKLVRAAAIESPLFGAVSCSTKKCWSPASAAFAKIGL